MATRTEESTVSVALVGNPNTGKSTLFNALSGMRQRVGNYPGVTVEKKVGQVSIDGTRFELIDLPGTYSLAPQSPDEMVAIDVLLGRMEYAAAPSVVIAIVDASNLERNLYLVSQLLELRRPTIVALNMIDIAQKRGIQVDAQRLERQLGVPVVPMQAHRRVGTDQLLAAVKAAITDAGPAAADPPKIFPDEFCREVDGVAAQVNGRQLPRYLVERLLLDAGGYLQDALLRGETDPVRGQLAAARERLGAAGHPVPAVEAMARYAWVSKVLEGVVDRPKEHRVTTSDEIDRVLTHGISGLAIFAILMLLIFSSVFSLATWPMEWIEGAAGWLSGLVEARMAEGALKSLVIDGVIAGVGGVLVFLPQIFMLFFFIAVLEDCGYMARAAYLMDKIMVRVGLSGKSFIPLLSSFACAIPGIMATRVIENPRDRLTTILVAPLMSCSARLPVYTLLIAAFIPAYSWGVLGLQAVTMFAMYTVGIVAAVFVALLLKKTILPGETPPFVMELPSYKWPSLWTVLHRMFDRGWAFVRRAGTVIFAVAIVVWAAAYYPRNSDSIDPALTTRLAAVETELGNTDSEDSESIEALEAEQTDLENAVAGAYLRQSYLGRMGRWIEPLVRPLGWDWRIGAAAIASFPAREVVIGTMGVIYNLGSETDEESAPLREKLKTATWDGTDRPVFSIPVALSLMVFFALCAQCAATLAVIRRETASWRWPAFAFAYMTALAYLAAMVTYQVGRLFIA